MSKKFFSLIHGDKVHVAPDTKVIPGKDFSKIVTAKEVLQEVKKDAEQYKIEVTSECETWKEQAQKEGFELGYTEWVEKIADLEEEIAKVRSDMERIAVPIALKAAKKIVGRELEISDSAVVDIIRNTLKAVAQHKKIVIYVNPKELEQVEKSRENIKKVFEHLETLSIRPQDDIDSGGCVVETEAGIINAQLENQWMILEAAFQKLIKKQSPPSLKKAVQEERKEED
ncbi:MAG: Yop proteins translocation protein L [Chlamydiae bacterium]|nr:Yop proteins translocation protein L [Chlamydiota bacterium]